MRLLPTGEDWFSPGFGGRARAAWVRLMACDTYREKLNSKDSHSFVT